MKIATLLEDKYRLGTKVAGIGLGTIDYINDTITLDARAAELFDLPADKAVSRDQLHRRIHKTDLPHIYDQVDRLLHPGDPNVIEVNHRVVHRNTDILWLSARKQVTFADPVGDADPVPIAGLVAIIDVTAQKQEQQRTQFLMDELNHRSKNLISVVQGIARRTLATGDMSDFEDRFSDRLAGLARNFDALVKGDWVYTGLADLIASHLDAFGRGSSRIEVNGPIVKLNSTQAQAIGMALHELATNATKYGALSNETGQVTIDWTVSESPNQSVTLRWIENKGPTVVPPTTSGFGQTVMKQMAAASVNGAVDMRYDPTGLYWQLTFPLQQADNV